MLLFGSLAFQLRRPGWCSCDRRKLRRGSFQRGVVEAVRLIIDEVTLHLLLTRLVRQVENQGLVGRRLEIPQIDRQGACRLWIVIVDIGEAEVVGVGMCWHGVEMIL
jgi:hypothetical protein